MLLITCPFWLSSLLTSELKHLWHKPINTFPTGTYIKASQKAIYHINLRSRIANKVFLQLGSQMTFSFDNLFDMTKNIPRENYLTNNNFSISVQTKTSQLNSDRTIQSICHKAIISKTNNTTTSNNTKHQIFIFIENDLCKIFINTSWPALHNRNRRTQTGEAPLKENIAASMVLLSWRKFHTPLRDPLCWSWTILIEAAMIAKNIAPWLQRHFAFATFPQFQNALFQEIKQQAQETIFNKEYDIKWTDKESKLISIAIQNAKQAWVWDNIHFATQDFFDTKIPKETTIITNPPYGKRISIDENLYEKLILQFQWKTSWSFLTSHTVSIPKQWRKSKEINNNGEICKLRKKI